LPWNSTISCKIIRELIYKKYKKILSKSLIYTIITRSIKYSYKKINKKIYSKNIHDLIHTQKIFSDKIKKINKNNIICVDETYIHSNCISNRGWGKKVVILKNIFELILLNYLLFPNCNYPTTQLFTKKFIKIIFEAMNSSNS